MTSLKEKIACDNLISEIEKKFIKYTDWDLAVKFWFVNRTLFAINLGLCGLRTNMPYDILKLERAGQNRIILYYLSKLYPDRDVLYLLPERYANIISDKDIEDVNMGTKKYKIIRTIRKCDETRLRYDHKSYTWDLEIIPEYISVFPFPVVM